MSGASSPSARGRTYAFRLTPPPARDHKGSLLAWARDRPLLMGEAFAIKPLHPRLIPRRIRPATWRSGYAADCKSAHPGSIPGVASTLLFCRALLAVGGAALGKYLASSRPRFIAGSVPR